MASANGRGPDRATGLWAITSYFNPLSYKSRLTNYRLFRERLGVPLITVELAYGSDFELGPGDADLLIQLRGGDVLWQKERLLNIALDRLPEECTKVAFLDCDILFGDTDWPARTSQLLDRVAIAQLYSDVHYLSAGAMPWARDVGFADPRRISIVSAVASGLAAEACLDAGNGPSVGNYSTGLAWAARRELLRQHRFYDAFIIGGADRAMIAAIYGCFEHLVRRQRLNERELAHFVAWAEPFRNTVDGAVGFIEGEVFHLWHGALKQRRWYRRYEAMPRFLFDPFNDIALSENSLWRWSSHKPDLHGYLQDFFAERREDG